MRRARLEHAVERLDAPEHDAEELAGSLAQVAGVNRWLGGARSFLHHFERAIPAHGPVTLLDVGTGSADLPRAAVRWARAHGRDLCVLATDSHPQMLQLARAHSAEFPEIAFEQADARALPYPDDSFDCAMMSLTLHHFEGDDIVGVLRELVRVSRRAVIVSDLERNWPNYLGARVLAATLWRGDRLTRHDGPMSVLRAFTRAELLALGRAAGMSDPRVSRHFFFRLILRNG